jgi:hypothetical protein
MANVPEMTTDIFYKGAKNLKDAFGRAHEILCDITMSSTIQSFNATLKSFLQELVDVFPDEPGAGKIQLFLSGFDLFVASNERAAMDAFLTAMAPHADMITTKDSKLFKKLELPGGIVLKDLWKKASEGTREATWQYLQMLFLLASTAAAVPPEMLNAIEGMASEYAGKVKSGEMDLSSVTSMLLGAGGPGGLDIASLLGGPPPPKSKK